MANESYSELKAMKLKMLLKRKRFSLIRLFQRVKKFINLWNKIKSKTIYRLEFDSKELIRKSIEDIKNRKELKNLLDEELFKKVILLSAKKGPGTIEKIYDLQEKRWYFAN